MRYKRPHLHSRHAQVACFLVASLVYATDAASSGIPLVTNGVSSHSIVRVLPVSVYESF
jgi:hypothetical protein